MARIIDHDVATQRIKIHFEGWSNRYDEVVRMTSSRLAPFRTHTRGFTGYTRCLVREDFQLNYTYQAQLIAKMKIVRQSKFSCFESATEATQFLRGELFSYCDRLLAFASPSPQTSQKCTEKVLEFMREVLLLLDEWLKAFPEYYSAFAFAQKHPNIILVNLPCAVAMSGFELIGMLKMVSGGSTRLFKDQTTFLQLASRSFTLQTSLKTI